MKAAGLYLNGERFEVLRWNMATMCPEPKPRRGRRRWIPALSDVWMSGRVVVPDHCKLLRKTRTPELYPVAVRYKGVSGLFYLDATVTVYKNGRCIMAFDGIAAGPVKVKVA